MGLRRNAGAGPGDPPDLPRRYRAAEPYRAIAGPKKALLVFHAPTDDTVGIESASHIFLAAKHPKSFVSLAGADHPHQGAAAYIANVTAAWAERLAEFRLELLGHDRQPRPAVLEHEAVVVLGQQRIDRDRHHACLDRAKESGRPVDSIEKRHPPLTRIRRSAPGLRILSDGLHWALKRRFTLFWSAAEDDRPAACLGRSIGTGVGPRELTFPTQFRGNHGNADRTFRVEGAT